MWDWIWPVCCVGCAVEGDDLCAACAPRGWNRPRSRSAGIVEVAALCRYDHPLGRALRDAKISGDRPTAMRLARLWGRRLPGLVGGRRYGSVVPAPSTARSLRRRGFSVAHLLAVQAGRALGLPVSRALHSGASARLAGLRAPERRAALRGAIRLRCPPVGPVLLVDDVLTTGATAEACAAVLLQAGCGRVDLVTFAAVDDLPCPRGRVTSRASPQGGPT